MSETVSLSELVFAYPLLLALVVTGALFCWWRIYTDARERRRIVETLRFIEGGQYEPAAAEETAALHAYAVEKNRPGVVTPAVDAIVQAYGAPIRRGHVWWIRKQIDGEIAAGAVPPACTSGKGLGSDPRAKSLRL